MKFRKLPGEKYPNFISHNRGWTTIQHHLPVIMKPLIAALAAMTFWRLVIFPSTIHFIEHSNEPILSIVLPLVGFIYVIFASIAITSIFDQYKEVSKSVIKKDVATFLLYRDEQLPILMHILIGAPTLIIVGFVMLYDYHNDTAMGMAAVFVVTFMLILIWTIATTLDDFRKSIWFNEKIPKEWYEIDIELYFGDKIKK